jgi:hypothetical protein
MILRVVVATLAVAVFVSGASGCGPSTASVGANSLSDPAHMAAQASDPRMGDSTAVQAAGPTPTPNEHFSIGGTTSAPATPEPASTTPSDPASAGTGLSPARESHEDEPVHISARHVLIQWMGAERAGNSVLRTREQALILAQEVLRRARAGEDVGRLAVEYSDEPNASSRGGSLGRFSKGQMVGAFDAVAFKLKVGQVSGIVETPFGFHIIQRTE